MSAVSRALILKTMRNTSTPQLRLLARNSFPAREELFALCRSYASKKADEGDDVDKPVPFSSSPAASYTTRSFKQSQGRSNKYEYEHTIVRVTTIIFMVYFCILREENDVDEKLGVSLYSQVPGLELSYLRVKKQSHGIDFSEGDQQRMQELEEALQK